MRNFLISHLTQIATYATIIVIFTHNVLFDREGACTCQGQKWHCALYISLPIFIIILLLLWKDKNFKGACRALNYMKTRGESQKRFWYIIFIQMVKASVIGLLWVVSVLFDGDWRACCCNGLQGEEAQIPCKKNRTLDEQAKVDEIKNWSKIIGLFTLLCLLFLVVSFSLLKWCNCCKKCSSCSDNCKNCPKCSEFHEKCPKCSEFHRKKCPKCSKLHENNSSCSDNCKKCPKCSEFHEKCPKCSEFHEKCPDCFNYRKMCQNRSHCCWKCLSYSDGDGPYELIIIQEEENIVNQILKVRAQEALKQKVKDILEKDKTNNYMTCFDAAQQVINQLLQEENQENEEETSIDHQEGDPSTSGDQSTASPTDPDPSTSGDQSTASPTDPPSGSKKLTDVSVTRSPRKKKKKTSRNEDKGE